MGEQPREKAVEYRSTQAAQAILLGADSFREGVESIRTQLLRSSTRDYFAALLEGRQLSSSEAVRRANLDRDYGRQVLTGTRTARRDTYIQLAFGMGLTVAQTQSMLNFLGKGPIYAVRERDAAIFYALERGYSLMDAQLLLDRHRLPLLGEATDDTLSTPEGEPPSLPTRDIEQAVRQADDFEAAQELVQDQFLRLHVSDYFDRLLRERGLTRKELLTRAGLKESIGFQLLNGTRTSRNPKPYLRISLVLGLNLNQTQQMLKYLEKGALYPLKEWDAALVFCIGHGYTLEETQCLLEQHGLEPL